MLAKQQQEIAERANSLAESEQRAAAIATGTVEARSVAQAQLSAIAAKQEAAIRERELTLQAQNELRRLDYRQQWDKAFLAHLRKLEKTKPVITCGDFNVAHQEIDLARPKANVGNAGFTPAERAGFDRFIDAGFIDTFREFETGPDHYSWWSYRAGARGKNIGWRIDYFLVSQALRPRLKRAFIQPEIIGSDHCPVGIELKRK